MHVFIQNFHFAPLKIYINKHTILDNKHTILDNKHTILDNKHTILDNKHTILDNKHTILDNKHTILAFKYIYYCHCHYFTAVLDEGYPRNARWALNLTSKFLRRVWRCQRSNQNP